MESRFRFIVVGCLQRLGSAAACVRCHSLMSLDDGGGRFFLIFWRATRRGVRHTALYGSTISCVVS
jgi:hypothetical protein